MARAFASANIVLAAGANLTDVASVALTMVGIARRGVDNTFDMICTVESSTAGDARVTFMVGDSAQSNNLLWLTSGSLRRTQVTFTAADGWCLVAVSKEPGASLPRGHKYVYGTNTWTHANSLTTISDQVASTAGGRVLVGGNWLGTSTYDYAGDLAALAMFKRTLTDAEIEQMPFSLQAWKTLAPAGLWLLDQSDTAQAVVDWTDGGANQTSLTGTTVAASSVPGFGYGHPILILPRLPLEADGTLTAGADLTGTASVSRPATGNLGVTATANGVAAGARPAGGSFAAAVTLSGTAGVLRPTAGNLGVSATPTASAAAVRTAAGDLSVTADTAATGAVGMSSAGGLVLTATLTAAGAGVRPTAGDLTLSASAAAWATAGYCATGDLSISATGIGVATADLPAGGVLAVTATAAASAALDLPTAGDLSVITTTVAGAVLDIAVAGDAALTAAGIATAALDTPVAGDLPATAAATADAALDMFTTGGLDLAADAAADMSADLPVTGALPVTVASGGVANYETGAEGGLACTAGFATALAAHLFTGGDLDLAAVLGADLIAHLFAEGTLELLFSQGAEANIQFSDYLWYGAQVYATIQDRDRWYGRLLDFVQATRGTSDYPVDEFGTGLAVVDEATVGEDTGPALYWSFRVSGELINEAQALSQEASEAALSGTTGTGQIVD